MKNRVGWKWEIDKDDPAEDLAKKVRFELNPTEQKELIARLLVHLEEPLNLLDQYADMISMLKENGGNLKATRGDCWEMAKKDEMKVIDNSKDL